MNSDKFPFNQIFVYKNTPSLYKNIQIVNFSENTKHKIKKKIRKKYEFFLYLLKMLNYDNSFKSIPAITSFWISDVPSYISVIRASR